MCIGMWQLLEYSVVPWEGDECLECMCAQFEVLRTFSLDILCDLLDACQ